MATMETQQRPRTFAEAEELLKAALPNYEEREGQQRLAKAIEDSIANGRHLLGEGPVGVGKSIAYSIPAILSGKRVVIATGTKALQDQLVSKDLPFLQEFVADFTYAVLKGRSNYLCVSALEVADPSEVPHLSQLLEFVAPKKEGEVINEEFSGERADLPFEIETKEWMKIAADTDSCSEFRCKDTKRCYANLARERAKAAQIVVVNHALYMTDLIVKEASDGYANMLGDHSIVIFDECHELPEYAQNALGSDFKEVGYKMLASEIRNFGTRWGHDLNAEVRGLVTAVDILWAKLQPKRLHPKDIIEMEEEMVALHSALVHLNKAFTNISTRDGTEKKQLTRLQKRVVSAIRRWEQFMLGNENFHEYVRWGEYETTARGERRLVLKLAPIDIAPYLRNSLWPHVTAILVSGTISTNGNMDFIAGVLGIEADQIIVPSPFDFANQGILYIPKDFPEPSGSTSAAWSARSVAHMVDLIKQSKGRALCLFTSVSEMRNAYDTVKDMVPYRVMMQGQGSNKDLIAEFKRDKHSVLFGTKSFMTGIDIQGEALSLLILNKLPFPNFTEPMFEAKSERIESSGGSSFLDLMMPQMTLTLHQAIGRLIRTQDDRGVAVILDSRLRTKGYGSGILRHLPPFQQVSTFTEVASWFGEEE